MNIVLITFGIILTLFIITGIICERIMFGDDKKEIKELRKEAGYDIDKEAEFRHRCQIEVERFDKEFMKQDELMFFVTLPWLAEIDLDALDFKLQLNHLITNK
jgi:hypothetical protein